MDAMKIIPEYIGHADMLPAFCQSILNVRDAFGPESEPWILNALISKLKGPAATGFASRLTQYKNIESLLSDLKRQYWGREGADSLKRKLQTVEQDATESAASFGLRVQSLHNSLINALDQDPTISESHREILKEIAIKEACEQFLCGLRPELEAATRAKQPTILSMAIDAAVAHESNRGLRDITKTNASQSKPSNANVSRLTTSEKVENLSPPLNNTKYNIFCDFCKKPGHEIIECRTLRRKIMNENSNKNISPSNVRNQSTTYSDKPYTTRNRNYENDNFRPPLKSSFRGNNTRSFNNRNDSPRRVHFSNDQTQSFEINRPDSPFQQSNISRQLNNPRQYNNRNIDNNPDYNNYYFNRPSSFNNNSNFNNRQNFEYQRYRSYNNSTEPNTPNYNRNPTRRFYNRNNFYNQRAYEHQESRSYNNLTPLAEKTDYNTTQQDSKNFNARYAPYPNQPGPSAPLNSQ